MEWDLNALQVVVDERLKDQEISLPAMTLNFYAWILKKNCHIGKRFIFWWLLCFGYDKSNTRKSERWTGILTIFVFSWIAFT